MKKTLASFFVILMCSCIGLNIFNIIISSFAGNYGIVGFAAGSLVLCFIALYMNLKVIFREDD